MSSDTDKPIGQTAGLPFARPIVRKITEELFRERSQWKYSDLVNRVVQIHRERGGIVATDPKFMMQRVLNNLKEDGSLNSPSTGWYCWSGSSSEGRPITEELGTNTPETVVEAIDDFESAIPSERRIGTGTECVYLYFNPNDQRLAELEGRDVWECKIGRTSSNDAIHRILGQGVRTAISHPPKVGLVLQTDDSAALERALHSSLRLIEAEVPDSLGAEWFFTSPARVEAWYVIFQNALAAIRGSSANPTEQPVTGEAVECIVSDSNVDYLGPVNGSDKPITSFVETCHENG